MISRSVPLWRSDTSCSPGHPEWNQNDAREKRTEPVSGKKLLAGGPELRLPGKGSSLVVRY